jgi:hypothetical protein
MKILHVDLVISTVELLLVFKNPQLISTLNVYRPVRFHRKNHRNRGGLFSHVKSYKKNRSKLDPSADFFEPVAAFSRNRLGGGGVPLFSITRVFSLKINII